jgi:hypothetical protein
MFALSFLFLIALVVVFSLVEVFLIEQDFYGWSVTMIFIASGLAYYLIGDVETYVNSIGWKEILFHHIPLYLGIGVGVAFLKWIQSSFKFASELADIKANLTRDLGTFDATNAEHLKKLYDRITSRGGNYTNIIGRLINQKASGLQITSLDQLITEINPAAVQQVDRITSWIFTWPFVIVHTAFVDLLIKLGKHVAKFFDAIFGKLTRAIVANGLK